MKLVCLFCVCVFFPAKAYTRDDEVFMHTYDSSDNEPLITNNIFYYITPLSSSDVYPSGPVLKFKVKACNGVYVFLTTSPAWDIKKNYYFVKIDEDPTNGRCIELCCVINEVNEKSSFTNFEHELLYCLYFQEFWISWKYGNITIGKGLQENFNEIGTRNCFKQKEIKIASIGLMTNKGANGQWLIINKVPRDAKYCSSRKTYAMGVILSTLYSLSSIRCSVVCEMEMECIGYNRNSITNTCEMLLQDNKKLQTRVDTIWVFYSRC